MGKRSILDRLKAGEVILGDGSYTITLEKRGYVLAHAWTPEAAVEHPDAVRQLALEYARAGADVTQTYTFFSDDTRLKDWHGPGIPSCNEINKAACKIAKQVAKEKGTITAGGIAMTDVYQTTRDKKKTVEELRIATKALVENDIDMLMCEYFRNIEEMEWAIEHVKTYGKPVAATLCVGAKGDEDGVSLAECAVRMAKAGADLVGLNCLFDPYITLENMKTAKEALDKAGLKPYLMCQPLGFRNADAGHFGWIDIPDYPYAMEPRQITRFEAAKFARDAYNLGIRYIGGCCGFEPYHIRSMAEELSQERGCVPPGHCKSEINDFRMAKLRAKLSPTRYGYKDTKDFWMNHKPHTGRPLSTAFCKQADPQSVNPSTFN